MSFSNQFLFLILLFIYLFIRFYLFVLISFFYFLAFILNVFTANIIKHNNFYTTNYTLKLFPFSFVTIHLHIFTQIYIQTIQLNYNGKQITYIFKCIHCINILLHIFIVRRERAKKAFTFSSFKMLLCAFAYTLAFIFLQMIFGLIHTITLRYVHTFRGTKEIK